MVIGNDTTSMNDNSYCIYNNIVRSMVKRIVVTHRYY
jgi:hypothetical protein